MTKITGIPTGRKKLDEITNGWKKGELILIGGRPATGKTLYLIDLIKKISVKSNHSVALFSLELSFSQVVSRMKITNEITNERRRKNRMTKIPNYSIYIDDTYNLAFVSFRQRALRLVNNFGVEVIIIDYLQLLQFENKNTQLLKLKTLAKKLNIIIIVLSQLPRVVDLRKDKRPTLSNLVNLGIGHKFTDIVLFTFRSNYRFGPKITLAKYYNKICHNAFTYHFGKKNISKKPIKVNLSKNEVITYIIHAYATHLHIKYKEAESKVTFKQIKKSVKKMTSKGKNMKLMDGIIKILLMEPQTKAMRKILEGYNTNKNDNQ